MKDIKVLKQEKRAMILAHHYQNEDVKAIADFVGDSLEMARVAASNDAEVLVICGVYFMAETAKILSPNKTVLVPRLDAGCPMADMVTADRLKEEKKKYPNAKVVCYVNSTADVKAESDICCTSSNAQKVLESIEEDEILFVPDQNLGHFVSTKVPSKTVHLWKGFCPTHHRVELEDVEAIRAQYPDAYMMAHPECRPEVVKAADYAGSTSQMIAHAKTRSEKTLIIGTERGIIETIKRDNPDKEIVLLEESMTCPNMKKTRVEDVIRVLETGENSITVDEEIRVKALRSIERMLEIK